MVGSLRFSAAVITRSATPTSFFSTAVGFRGFLAIGDPLPLLPLAPGARLRFGVALYLARRLGFGRRRRRHRLFDRGRPVRRHDRHLAFDALRRDDDRMRQAFGAAAVLPQQLIGLAASGDLGGHLQELVLQLRGGESTALEPVTRLDDLLDVELEDVAPAELAVCPLAPSEEGAQPPAAFAQGQGDLLVDLVVLGDGFLDSLVKGTHTEAMWTKITIGPAGSEPRDCATP